MPPKLLRCSVRERTWLDVYLTTFNATRAAHAAYQIKPDRRFRAVALGVKLKKKFREFIITHLEESGLSPEALDAKLLRLLNARTVKHFTFQGTVINTRVVADHPTQLGALKLANQLTRRFVQRHEHQVSGGVVLLPAENPPS